MVLTDLPYGTTACKWDTVIPFKPMWKLLNGITLKNTPILLFGSEPFSSSLRMSNIDNYRYDWVWRKNNCGNFQLCNSQPLKYHELISVFYEKTPLYNPQGIVKLETPRVLSNKGKAGKLGHLSSEKKRAYYKQVNSNYPSSILYFKRPSSHYHPTEKPVNLLRYLIRTYTKKGDVVLDFTMGSGSTGVACKLEHRKFIGIEKDEDYFKTAFKRIYGIS